KSGKLELIEDLKCINLDQIPVPFWNKNKVAVVLIALIGLAIVAYVILQGGPELAIDPDPFNFDFEPETSAQTFSIWNDGDGTLEWYVDSDPDWIMVSRDSGTDSGRVTVSVNSAGMDPGRHIGIITVESNGGTKTGTISLYIGEPPRIHYFNADPEHIDGLEGETTLSWEVSGATSVTIDGVGPVEVSEGSIDRWVEQTTTFILRATNDAGVSDVRDTTVYVKSVDSPVIHYFIANPESISPGEKSTLRWDVSGVETVTIDNEIGEIGGIENTDVFLDETTIYILTAENDAGKDAKTVTVHVEKPELALDPDPPSFEFELGTHFNIIGANTRTFSISNSGDGNLHWSIHTKEEWITIDPAEGVNDNIITIKIITKGLDADYYEGIIYIDSNGGKAKGEISLDLFYNPPIIPPPHIIG
ncbi:MAG: hypothetical protein K8R13_09900, partial [Methanococcoides sp.]|nr:hypothetical protein [Methanococcoides sp.]